jgi:hypothetical protein
MKPLRKEIPLRSCTENYDDYRAYKDILRSDFNKRCGYCNDLDFHCNGSRGYHIDHFIPRKPYEDQNPKVTKNYKNLVYSCPYCNIAKSNDWPSGNIDSSRNGNEGYVDPCLSEYDEHLARDDNGSICPKTQIGNYMFIHLKLGLRRHQLSWVIEKLGALLDELDEEIEELKKSSIAPEELCECLIEYQEISREYRRHEKLFYKEL